jgi:hypothetical protein
VSSLALGSLAANYARAGMEDKERETLARLDADEYRVMRNVGYGVYHAIGGHEELAAERLLAAIAERNPWPPLICGSLVTPFPRTGPGRRVMDALKLSPFHTR